MLACGVPWLWLLPRKRWPRTRSRMPDGVVATKPAGRGSYACVSDRPPARFLARDEPVQPSPSFPKRAQGAVIGSSAIWRRRFARSPSRFELRDCQPVPWADTGRSCLPLPTLKIRALRRAARRSRHRGRLTTAIQMRETRSGVGAGSSVPLVIGRHCCRSRSLRGWRRRSTPR
jgi:hypothetical protein